MSRPKDGFEVAEMGLLQKEITGKICISCNQSALCWEQPNYSLQEAFSRLVHSVETLGMPDKEVEDQLSYYCPYASAVAEEAIEVFEKARLNLSWHNRLLENREVIAQQLDAMAYIMEDCAKEYSDVTNERVKMVASIRYRLKERGILTKELNLYEKKNGRYSLHLKLSSRWGNYITLKDVTKGVNEAMKISMVPLRSSKTLFGRETSTLTFEEEPSFYALYGVSRRTKDGAQISGDNFSLLDLEVGESVLTLSDGMGSGIRACKESEMVIELIGRFLEAGFQKEMAIRMMNSAMVIQGEDGMYSTMDMASIDLYSRECEFYKIGASASYIKRGEVVETISSPGLPVGIYPHVEIGRENRVLENGDFLVLISDGVLDHIHVPNPEEKVSELLETIKFNNPGKFANQVMERILLFTGGKVPDDMTVLVAGIWEK
jgi:stage II sporulation protein E